MIPPFFLEDRQCERLGPSPQKALEKLAAFQLEALNKTIVHAKSNSRFYATHLGGISAVDSFDAFEHLPFTLPRHIQVKSAWFLAVSQDKIARIVTLETSGTTAPPKRLFFTDSDLEATIDFFSLVLSHLTRPGERGLILLPGATPASAGDLLKTALARIGVVGIVPGIIQDFNETLDLLTTHTPSLVIGLPVQVMALGELMRQGCHPLTSVRHIILTSDSVAPAVKQRVRTLFGCSVFDHYGMTETGFGGGIDCFAHGGYHLRETDLYFEIIDPSTGKLVPTGSWGEIVVTTLNRWGMPLIRYRTGDISRFIKEPCPCNSIFRRMDYVRYRQDHRFILPNGQGLSMPDLDDLLFNISGVLDFDVTLGPGPGAALKLEIIIKVVDKEKVRPGEIDMRLSRAPLLKPAIDSGALILGPIQTTAFEFNNTYRGKRRIGNL
jgi:phenylacetate-coenzyme A ligase PaaK-like adenylate-forming protein